VCSAECTAHQNYKEAIVNAKDRDAVATGRSTGHPVRCLKNRLSREYDRLEASGASQNEMIALGAGRLRSSAVDGDIDNGSVMAGQISGMIKDVLPSRDIILKMVYDANKIAAEMNNLFNGGIK
jgi:enoyl-[acyl-carrier protein] reductase II